MCWVQWPLRGVEFGPAKDDFGSGSADTSKPAKVGYAPRSGQTLGDTAPCNPAADADAEVEVACRP